MAGIPHHMTGWGGGRLAGRSAPTYTHRAQLGFGHHRGHTFCVMATIPGRSVGGGGEGGLEKVGVGKGQKRGEGDII